MVESWMKGSGGQWGDDTRWSGAGKPTKLGCLFLPLLLAYRSPRDSWVDKWVDG